MPISTPCTISTAMLLLACGLAAQDPPNEPARRELAFQDGTVSVHGGIATIALPDGWRYLQARDARYVVEDLWGNPPDASTHGLVVPPARDGEEADWAIIVSFSDEGYVSDDDAAGIDYDEMLSDMQAGARDENAERQKQGYPPIELVGWAEPPHYDAADKKLYWAKTLRFGDGERLTLNYDVRILGRRGVLVMQAVASQDQLAEVAKGSKEILAATSFAAGHRYADFDASLDKVAAYGIGGLIAGKALAKAGILKLLLKPLLVLGAVVGGFFMKLFGKGKAAAERPTRRRRVNADASSAE